MADKKIKDKDLDKALQASKSYCVKSLWGIPKTFLKILKALDKFNQNKQINYQVAQELDLQSQSGTVALQSEDES